MTRSPDGALGPLALVLAGLVLTFGLAALSYWSPLQELNEDHTQANADDARDRGVVQLRPALNAENETAWLVLTLRTDDPLRGSNLTITSWENNETRHQTVCQSQGYEDGRCADPFTHRSTWWGGEHLLVPCQSPTPHTVTVTYQGELLLSGYERCEGSP